ncbi:hypothetical protein JXA88_12290 [Candidatus Fermentibacteria bacterium]|nr:hypothetical protein [Candidatus Fermentibacteria bacterium]
MHSAHSSGLYAPDGFDEKPTAITIAGRVESVSCPVSIVPWFAMHEVG